MTYDKHDCDLMCERLAAYLEGDLAPADQATAEQHLAECATCAEVLSELRAISAEAATMPLLTPSRELWTEIEARISTPVVSLGSASPAVRRGPRRMLQFSMAAAALIAVSVGTTYFAVTHRSGATPEVTVAQQPVAQHRDSITAPVPAAAITPRNVTFVPRKKEVSAARVYDHEITMLDSLVRTRRSLLDPKTVAIIEQNLRIINQAIIESRRALAKDPKSPLLSNQLDNVLSSKVELLSTIAFLPTQS